jgi:hypothetical protein
VRAPKLIVVAGVVVTGLVGCSGAAPAALPDALPGASLQARVADAGTYAAAADGDLWPSCWAGDGSLYAALGDGMGFGTEFFDAAVNRIDGDDPSDLTGETLAGGDAIGQVWSGEGFTRKPTGMVCVGDDVYLALQDLRTDFNEAPAASISVSHDGGRTWEWDRSAPMFADHVFTTVFFLDFGRGGEHRPDGYVYAYGLDGNWRDSFDDSVPDPQDLYLARVPEDRIQDRASWEFYAGGGDAPVWSSDIADRVAVLHDERRRYPSDGQATGGTVGAADLSVISQGGVLYDAPLGRYLYTSWTELTYEFYEAPQPWGPWTLFLSKDFGPYPWTEEAYGGYGTTIPSKFLSADGRTAWLQSNVCPCAPAGMSSYYFGLRKLELEPVMPAG